MNSLGIRNLEMQLQILLLLLLLTSHLDKQVLTIRLKPEKGKLLKMV